MTAKFQPIRLSVKLETPEQAQALWLYLNTNETTIAEMNTEYEAGALELPHTSVIDDLWGELDDKLEEQGLVPPRRTPKKRLGRKNCMKVQNGS